MKAVKWMKEHLLGACIVVSALIQLVILLQTDFTTGSRPSDDFIPMTVRPFVEALPEPKQKVVKKAIEETEEAEEAAEEQQEPTPPQKTAAAQNNEPRFMPFIRVDQIARASSPLIPGYPETARNAGIEGTVVLEVYIDEQGQVRKVNVRKGIGFGCDEAAIRKVRGTRFIPAQMNGRPVAVRQIITFEFRLE